MRAEDSGLPFLLEPEALATNVEHVAVVQQPVQDRRGNDGVAQKLAPFAEALVRGINRVCQPPPELRKRGISSHGGRMGLTRAGVPDSAIMRRSGMALSIFRFSGSKVLAIYTRQPDPRLGILSRGLEIMNASGQAALTEASCQWSPGEGRASGS